MSTRTRIASFAVLLGAVFAVAFMAGSVFEPVDTEAGGGHAEAGHAEASHDADHGQAGYSLLLGPTAIEPGRQGKLFFAVEDPARAAVEGFDTLHERKMHLIVIRDDGTRFQHLHPRMQEGGLWTTPLTLPAAGRYRAFADFSVAGEQHTLSEEIVAAGPYERRPFPPSTRLARVDGYEVRLADAPLRAGGDSELRFTVSRGGEPVAVEDYLGARGHLVALREGDLDFLHVHPEAGTAPSVIEYGAHFPGAGRYRLFLQFKHEGQVRTAPFTVEVER